MNGWDFTYVLHVWLSVMLVMLILMLPMMPNFRSNQFRSAWWELCTWSFFVFSSLSFIFYNCVYTTEMFVLHSFPMAKEPLKEWCDTISTSSSTSLESEVSVTPQPKKETSYWGGRWSKLRTGGGSTQCEDYNPTGSASDLGIRRRTREGRRTPLSLHVNPFKQV
jgi:hypothetical protein